jgi:hypothetical protein
LHTNVVTVVAASEALRVPPVTVTGFPAAMLAVDEVTYGVHEAGAVPPLMAIGTVAADVPLLMATTTTVLSVLLLKAERRRFVFELPETSTMM